MQAGDPMAPPLRKSTAKIPLRSNGSLRIAVVADTHSTPHPDAARHLQALRPDAILHAGDIGDLRVLDGLASIAPLHAVRGNIDTRADDLPDVLALDLTTAGDATLLRIFVTHIAVVGPRLRGDVARMARNQGAQMVVCGHSHVPFMGRDGDLTVFNPGSIGPRRFHLPIVFGTIDVTRTGVALAHIDCETGQRWSPP
jgi:putative phosphoesterase